MRGDRKGLFKLSAVHYVNGVSEVACSKVAPGRVWYAAHAGSLPAGRLRSEVRAPPKIHQSPGLDVAGKSPPPSPIAIEML